MRDVRTRGSRVAYSTATQMSSAMEPAQQATRRTMKNEKNPPPSVTMLEGQNDGCRIVSKFTFFTGVKIIPTLNPGGRGFIGLFSRGV